MAKKAKPKSTPKTRALAAPNYSLGSPTFGAPPLSEVTPAAAPDYSLESLTFDAPTLKSKEKGYQRARIWRALKQMERGGAVLRNFTLFELRRLLECLFEENPIPGLGTPSRQVLNSEIKQYLRDHP
jgi:hypothetical protein